MSQDKTKQQKLDEFWDISSLIPKRKAMRPSGKSVETIQIGDDEKTPSNAQNKLSRDTVIERFIPPYSADNAPKLGRMLFSYVPEKSLIHKVTVYRQSSSYDFYSEFCQRAKRLWNEDGTECEYADFFSYSPQYDQLTAQQMRYYLWWRKNLREGVYIKTNLSYIYLYTYELINSANADNARYCRDMMLSVLIGYHKELMGARARYIRWIADFGLIHRIRPPQGMTVSMLKEAGALKEYFVRIHGNTYDGWAQTLLEYCNSYDYRTSKYYKDENKQVFDTHVLCAVTEVVRALSDDEKILARLPFDDCKICACAFEGALCASNNRYNLEVEYCSFSRSHELRFVIGDAVKHSENKIRAYLSVKSRLTVYSLASNLCEVINEYFARALPTPQKQQIKREAPQEYDVLYDLPRAALNLSNAEKIENESWNVTRELVEAFDVPTETVRPAQSIVVSQPSETDGKNKSAFGEYLSLLCALRDGNDAPLTEYAKNSGMPIEALVDSINEIAVAIIGDIIIEEVDGRYALIEDYADCLDAE